MPTTRKTTPRKRAATKKPAKTIPPASPPLAAVTDLPVDELEPTLLSVLNAVVKDMDWLADSDEAMVELAREYCRQIDATKRLAEEWDAIAEPLREMAEITESKALMARLQAVERALDVSRQVGWLGPHLANTLRAIGGAPAERKGLKPDGPLENRLAAIRSNAARRKTPRTS